MSYNVAVTETTVEQTTDATPKPLATISLPPHSTARIEIFLSALCTDGTWKPWNFSGWAVRSGSGTVDLYDDTLNNLTSAIPSVILSLLIPWSLTISKSGGDINFSFVGQSGKTIDLDFMVVLSAKFTP